MAKDTQSLNIMAINSCYTNNYGEEIEREEYNNLEIYVSYVGITSNYG